MFLDPLGFTTTMAFDALNRQVSVQEPSGAINTTVFDPAGNVVNTIDPVGNTTTFVLDALNRQTQTINAKGGITTTIFDAVGNVVNVIDPNNNKTTFVFDALNRQVQEVDPLGHSATFAYDQASRLTSTTDRDGRRRDFSYDADNRKLTETWVVAGSTVNVLTFTYDQNSNLLSGADSHGAYTLTYDGLDRLASEQEPFGLSLTLSYDAVGNRTQLQDSLGGITTSLYDAVHELTSRQFGGAGQTPLRIDLAYTARGQLAGETRYSDLAGTHTVGTTSLSYDGAARLVHLQHQDGNGTNLANYTYSYDIASRLTAESLNGSTTSYNYDSTNQLTNDSNHSYSYDANGNRTMSGYQTGPNNQLLSDGTWNYSYDKVEGDSLRVATRQCRSERRKSCADFAKFSVLPSGCKSRPTTAEPGRSAVSLAVRAATPWLMRRQASTWAVGPQPRNCHSSREAEGVWSP